MDAAACASGSVWANAAASKRTPENLPAQPRQYLALSRLGAWQASQYLVIVSSHAGRAAAALRHRNETVTSTSELITMKNATKSSADARRGTASPSHCGAAMVPSPLAT